MFAEVKELLTYVEGDEYDGKIIAEIRACALDLTRTAEIVLDGEINIVRSLVPATSTEAAHWEITDGSTVRDPLILKTIAVWCDKEIGNPPNKEMLEKAYDSLKGRLRMSRRYTNYGEA